MRADRDWAMLVVLCAAAVLSGVLEVLFTPLYAGSVPLPVVVPIAIGGGFLLPRVGRALVPTSAGTFAPLLSWLVPVLGLALFPRPEGDVLVSGGGAQQWTYYGVLFGGCLAGFVSAGFAGGAVRLSR